MPKLAIGSGIKKRKERKMLKVKNIAFTGFMAAILMGATATDARAVSVASTEYVNAQVGAVSGEVTTLSETVGTKAAQSDLNALSATVDTKAAASDVTALEGRVGTAESDIDSLEGRVSANESGISTLNNNVGDVQTLPTTAKTIVGAINEINSDVYRKAETYLKSEVNALIGDIQAGDVDLKGYVKETTLNEELAKKQNNLTEDQLKAVDSGITGALVEKYNAYEAAIGSKASQTDLDALSQTVEGKADAATSLAGYGIADAYTSTQTDNLLAGKQDNLSGSTYVSVENDTVSLKVDGEIAAGNEGLVKGSQIYTYALPKPADCENETCVLSVDLEGQPYWMKLELPTTQGA